MPFLGCWKAFFCKKKPLLQKKCSKENGLSKKCATFVAVRREKRT